MFVTARMSFHRFQTMMVNFFGVISVRVDLVGPAHDIDIIRRKDELVGFEYVARTQGKKNGEGKA